MRLTGVAGPDAPGEKTTTLESPALATYTAPVRSTAMPVGKRNVGDVSRSSGRAARVEGLSGILAPNMRPSITMAPARGNRRTDWEELGLWRGRSIGRLEVGNGSQKS